jgi:hypothetical protein
MAGCKPVMAVLCPAKRSANDCCAHAEHPPAASAAVNANNEIVLNVLTN